MTEAMLTPWGEALDREHPLPEYPRPQLRRNSYLNLNGIWEYAITKTAEKPAAMQGEIVVPFSPETPLSGVGHILQPDEYLWYRRSVTLPEGFFRGGRLLLHFGAVDQRCTVWVNGQEAGSHTGGYLPFALDVTELIEGDAFTLELRVTDPTDTGSLSRGKQRLKNTGIWYTPQSGIWQTVWMECVPENYLRSLRITPKPEENAVHIRLEADDPAMAAVTICRDGGIIAEGQTDENGESTLTIPAEELRLWSPEDPFLYDVSIVLPGGDKVESYFGMRAFGIGKDEKGLPRLLLNGKPYFQNGLLDQGYWSDGYYTAPSDEALIHDIAEMKRLGFNMLRKHIKVEPLRWYYHCDRLGMLVWQDMMNGGESYSPLSIYVFSNLGLRVKDDRYRYFSRSDEAGRTHYYEELGQMIDLLYNIVSLALWVPFNEGWGQFDALKAAEFIRKRDDTRPIDHASGWYDQGGGDIKSIHWYFRPYHHKQPPKEQRPICLTEYGGYNCAVPGHCWGEGAEFGYKKIADPAEFNRAFQKLMEEQIIPAKERGLAAAVYTQVSDVEGERNGLLTYDRKVCKANEAIFRAVNAKLTGDA
ncbi:MAG: glycoside hydrolase family 2 [Clostridiales bacterium]|nr:glycoside hydrolase family 2 [Clostridiales bacterium]